MHWTRLPSFQSVSVSRRFSHIFTSFWGFAVGFFCINLDGAFDLSAEQTAAGLSQGNPNSELHEVILNRTLEKQTSIKAAESLG